MDIGEGTTCAPSDNFVFVKDLKNGTNDNYDKNTMDRLCVMALIVIIEPVVKSQSSRANK